MNLAEASEAALNNALWCDALCRAHGRPGEFLPGWWINRRQTPRLYPNVVTLSPADAGPQHDAIAELVESGLPGEWSVKDSFASLDLAPLGFRVLFEAQWIHRPAVAAPEVGGGGLRWTRVREARDLRAWEVAWRGDSPGAGDAAFRPALLGDPNIAVIAGHRGGRLAAGVIANRTRDVVGVSNLFALGEEASAACIGAVCALFPGLALVGYEPAARLAGLRRIGFEPVGPLRVWAREIPAS